MDADRYSEIKLKRDGKLKEIFNDYLIVFQSEIIRLLFILHDPLLN